jgi:hypothetical protein
VRREEVGGMVVVGGRRVVGREYRELPSCLG